MKWSDNDLDYQAFEQKYSHLLSWEEAEQAVGRKLDWNSNFDSLLYHGMLMNLVNELKKKGDLDKEADEPMTR